MVELKGSLSGIGLPSIVQLIGELHHSGSLVLTRPPARCELGFDDGRLASAAYGDEHGLEALAACTRELADAEFRFVEGPHTGEREIDMSAAELQRYLARVLNGEVPPEPLAASPPVKPSETVAPGPCPFLGFADDPSRHYSRPTALHRCFAGGAASLVTGQEQRELCLAGRFATCPRYRNVTSLTPSPRPQVVAPPPVPEPPVEQVPVIPAGVATRLTAASQMQVSPQGPAADPQDPTDRPDGSAAPVDRPARRPRGVLLLAAGAVLGLLVLAGILAVAVPALEGRLGQRPNQGAAAFEAVPTPVRAVASPARATDVPTALAVGARGTDVPTIGATPPAIAPSPAQPANVPARSPVPAVAAVVSRSPSPAVLNAGPPLMDDLFAAGPRPSWLENPPFATWSDGAYRLLARQIGNFVAVGVPLDKPISDVVVSATFRKTGGPPGGGYGLIIRNQGGAPLNGTNQNFTAYVVETGDLGEFGVWRRDGDHWVDVVPWTRSSSVRAGGSPNDLSARAVGPQLTFTVNGTEVARVQDAAVGAGGVGVFVGGDNNDVALDHFVVQPPT
jgi:Domain of unknown function (DUF4388)